MHITEVVIDGFKSYAKRTVISGWDKQFNAITGFNGTGKSNILDAICFVLGISNLSQVRVTNLRELVYKQGQGRVNKASVSIIFDNSDKAQSPVGYEGRDKITVTREIIIGGRNKYMINGVTAQLNRVQNLFHSVQLNVNNPHFLIMQGRITKVLNMKPIEILGMIQEAAGTRMFDTKKQAALKTIGKKQHKVDEINKILTEEITPQLEKLREDAKGFLQWSSNNHEIDRLRRFCVAYEYLQAKSVLDKHDDLMGELDSKVSELEHQGEQYQEDIGALSDRINDLRMERDENTKAEFAKMEVELAVVSKDLVRATSMRENADTNLATEKAALLKAKKAIDRVRSQLDAKQGDAMKSRQSWSSVVEEQNQLTINKKRLEGQQLGFAQEEADGQGGSLVQQHMEAERVLATLEAEKSALDMSIKQGIEGEVKSKRAQMKKLASDYKSMEKEKATLMRSKSQIEASMSVGKAPDERDIKKVVQKLGAVTNKLTEGRRDIDNLRAALSRTEFAYEPSNGIVHGRVARLIRVREEEAALAIEVCAGGKLYNVVVDTDATASEIIGDKRVRNRVTCIPLNKIQSGSISTKVLNQIAKVAGEDAQLALNLTEFNPDMKAAMEFVFGKTVICKDSDVAKLVTFECGSRAVTLQGDVFEPRGLVTGGSRNAGSSVLSQLVNLYKHEEALAEVEFTYTDLCRTRDEMLAHQEELAGEREQLDLVSHELQLLEERMSESMYAVLERSIQELETSRSSMKEEIASKTSAISETKKLLVHLAKQIKKSESGSSDDIKTELVKIKKKIDSYTSKVAKAKAEYERVSLEVDSLENDVADLVSQEEKLNLSIAELQSELEHAQEIEDTLIEQLDAQNRKLAAEKKQLSHMDKEISALIKKRDVLTKKRGDLALEIKKINHQVVRQSKEKETATEHVEKMLDEFEWIASESKMFGTPGSDYDFERNDPGTAHVLLETKIEEQARLDKRVNKKAMSMKEKAEEDYQNLMERRGIILQDKQKIEEVISELELKKNIALKTTWVKVNEDFGSIFSTLLPNSQATLQPPDGCTVLDGLEVRVAFGETWKESLSELSGGQRSLLALSLILSLLLFKPAPMYILDEVDAALDLSHTQNIGRMLKKHFSHSQFIIVSLKEGMFNNANVLFRTKFVDGVSAVSRTVNRSQ